MRSLFDSQSVVPVGYSNTNVPKVNPTKGWQAEHAS
jgi:hypothetical protein